MIMNLDIICIVDCDDCRKSIIIDPTYVTIIIGDSATAAAICSHCERPIVEEINTSLAKDMISKGVKALSWVSGEEITINDIGN